MIWWDILMKLIFNFYYTTGNQEESTKSFSKVIRTTSAINFTIDIFVKTSCPIYCFPGQNPIIRELNWDCHWSLISRWKRGMCWSHSGLFFMEFYVYFSVWIQQIAWKWKYRIVKITKNRNKRGKLILIN